MVAIVRHIVLYKNRFFLVSFYLLFSAVEMKLSNLSIPLYLFLTAAFADSHYHHHPPKVNLKSGTITGISDDHFDQDIFLGIPYATPPINKNRFEAVGLYDVSLDGFQATNYGPSCYFLNGSGDNRGLNVSEDCLQLNVIRPRINKKTKNLPVAVWIHGGKLSFGASSRDIYNLSYPVLQSVLGGTPVIGVSINFRLFGFGFLASKELKENDSLNLGLRDQRVALKWVQENIEAFGGDPNNVAIWGESSGGWNAAMQSVAYDGKNEGLFHKAVMESGSLTSIQYPSEDEYEKDYQQVLKATDCQNLECLKKIDAAKLNDIFSQEYNKAGKLVKYAPVVDGKFFSAAPHKLLSNGKFIQMPIIVGATVDEGTNFPIVTPANSDGDIINGLHKTFPDLSKLDIDVLLSDYPNDPAKGSPFNTGNLYTDDKDLGSQWKRSAALGGDLNVIAPRRYISEKFSLYGNPVYSYNWNQTTSGKFSNHGCSHFAEVAFVFGNTLPEFKQSGASPIADSDPKLHQFAYATSRLFMSFLATGDPNNADLSGLDKYEKYFPKWKDYKHGGCNMYFSRDDCHLEKDDWRSDGIEYINYNLENRLNH